MKHNQIGTPGVFTERQQALLDHYGTRAESTFVELRDPALRAHVLHAGRGEPVVMVHGGNSVAVGMQPLFGQLAERFSVYAADRPGCGLTDSYVYRRTDMRRHGVAFIGSLLDQLGLETVALVGNSMGGFWCMAFALAHPERVSRLILLGEPAEAHRGSAPGSKSWPRRGWAACSTRPSSGHRRKRSACRSRRYSSPTSMPFRRPSSIWLSPPRHCPAQRAPG